MEAEVERADYCGMVRDITNAVLPTRTSLMGGASAVPLTRTPALLEGNCFAPHFPAMAPLSLSLFLCTRARNYFIPIQKVPAARHSLVQAEGCQHLNLNA